MICHHTALQMHLQGVLKVTRCTHSMYSKMCLNLLLHAMILQGQIFWHRASYDWTRTEGGTCMQDMNEMQANAWIYWQAVENGEKGNWWGLMQVNVGPSLSTPGRSDMYWAVFECRAR